MTEPIQPGFGVPINIGRHSPIHWYGTDGSPACGDGFHFVGEKDIASEAMLEHGLCLECINTLKTIESLTNPFDGMPDIFPVRVRNVMRLK